MTAGPSPLSAGLPRHFTLPSRPITKEYGIDGRPAQRTLLLRGAYARDAGELDAAIETFELFVELYPGNPLPLIQLGETYEAAGRWEEALGTYETSSEIMWWPADLEERLERVRGQLGVQER